MKKLFRFGQIHIQIKFLNIRLFFCARRKCLLFFLKPFPVPFGKQSSLPHISRKQGIIRPHKKQGFQIAFQTGSLHISNHNLIHTRRDHTDFCLFQSCIQKLTVLFQRNPLVSQKFCKFVKQFQHNAIDLCVLFRQCQLFLFRKTVFHHFQLLLNLIFHKEAIHCFTNIAHCLFSLFQNKDK